MYDDIAAKRNALPFKRVPLILSPENHAQTAKVSFHKHSYEILRDVNSANNKEIKWKSHKLISLRLAQAYRRAFSKKYKRIIQCGSLLEFRRYEDNTLRLKYANFCQTRLCPMCNWRRAKKVFFQVSRIMSKINEKYRFVFLTLTVKNVASDELNGQIDTMYKAFKVLCLRVGFKSAVRGWCRVFEITHNWSTQEFHPHFHVVLAVDTDYFTSGNFIKQDDFCEMWQSCLGVDYKPIVDVRTFKESERGKGKEVAEVAKYTIKASNILADLRGVSEYGQDIQAEAIKISEKITDKIIITLDEALTNRRLIGYGGIFKETHNMLKLDDDADGDLIHTGNDVTSKGGMDFSVERFGWNIKERNYFKLEAEN